MIWDLITQKGTIESIDILKEDTRGEASSVKLKIRYQGKEPLELDEDVVLEKGKWKTSLLKTLGSLKDRLID